MQKCLALKTNKKKKNCNEINWTTYCDRYSGGKITYNKTAKKNSYRMKKYFQLQQYNNFYMQET